MKLFGKNPVIERLRSNPSSIKTLYIQEGVQDAGYFYAKAKQKGIAAVSVPRTKMLKISRGTNNQGIMAEVDDFAYSLYGDVLETALAKGHTLIFLDELNDPQNLGSIIRTLATLGKFAIVLPHRHCVEVTAAVLRVACGGENYVPIAQVTNLSRAIQDAKTEGFSIAGTTVKGGVSLAEAELAFPLGIVMGSEHKGLRDIILKLIDQEITIPMSVDTLSLNVAQAMGIIAYEITKQKKIKKAARSA